MGIMMISGGLMTTIQDAGRRGYQRYGMGVSGAVDVHSYVYANVLVGNTHNEAVLEVTIIGPTIEFTSNSVIAVTGGDLSPALDGSPLPMYRAVRVTKGSILTFGAVRSGCRAYISFAGGLAVAPVMGSRSTYLKANLGGYEGRNLQAGDEIAFRRPASCPRNLERRRMDPQIFNGDYTVRVLMGPQDDRFTRKGIETFLGSAYKVTSQFDRMGYRLAGPEIEHVTDGNIITDGISFGAIQVPDDHQPIIMLADRQTTGGYAKIANVINVDMPMVAQSKAGDTIRFVKTDIDTAQDEFVRFIEKRRRMREEFDREEPEKAVYPVSGSAAGAAAQTAAQAAKAAPAPAAQTAPAPAAKAAPAPAVKAAAPAAQVSPAPAVKAAPAPAAPVSPAPAPAPQVSPAPAPAVSGAAKTYRVTVNGKTYEVSLSQQ